MSQLLYKIPESLVAGYQSGQFQLFGSILKDTANGRIIGHVQQTGILDTFTRSALQAVQAPLTGGFSPLGVVSIWQNGQISGRLRDMQGTLGLLQNMQIGTLAVSGVGLGISVAGFALVLNKLKGITSHLETLENKIDGITKERRGDDIQVIFSDISSDVEAVETLANRNSPHRVAETTQLSLAKNAKRLEVHFSRHADLPKATTYSTDDLDLLWSLAAAIRLCHEAGVRALFTIDEIATARQLTEKQANSFLKISEPLSPDALARLTARSTTDPDKTSELRRAAMPQAQTLVTGLRDTVSSIASQSSLAGLLLEKQISGPQYLEAIENEKEDALLFLPT